MTAISVDDSTKREFDELKPDDCTHDEFVSELLDAYRRDNGEVVDVDAIVDRITEQTAASVELGAYRGTRDAIQSKLDVDQ